MYTGYRSKTIKGNKSTYSFTLAQLFHTKHTFEKSVFDSKEQLFVHCLTFACNTFLPSHGLVIWLYYTFYTLNISVSACVCSFRRQLPRRRCRCRCRRLAVAFSLSLFGVLLCGCYCHCHFFCWWLCVSGWVDYKQSAAFNVITWQLCMIHCVWSTFERRFRLSLRTSTKLSPYWTVETWRRYIGCAPIFDHVVYSIDTHIYFNIKRHNSLFYLCYFFPRLVWLVSFVANYIWSRFWYIFWYKSNI